MVSAHWSLRASSSPWTAGDERAEMVKGSGHRGTFPSLHTSSSSVLRLGLDRERQTELTISSLFLENCSAVEYVFGSSCSCITSNETFGDGFCLTPVTQQENKL